MAWWDDAAEAVGSGLGWFGDAAEAVVDTVTERIASSANVTRPETRKCCLPV